MVPRRYKTLLWILLFFSFKPIAIENVFAHERFEFTPPVGWAKERNIFGDEESYVWRDEKGVTIARIMVQFLARNRDIVRDPASAHSAQDFDKLFLAVRPKSLEPLGFSQWQIESSSVKNIDDKKHILYEVQGSYREPNQKQISFIELNHFIGRNYYQITWTQEKSKFTERYANIAKDILTRFKPL